MEAVPARELLRVDAMLPGDLRQRLAALHDVHGGASVAAAHIHFLRARAGRERA